MLAKITTGKLEINTEGRRACLAKEAKCLARRHTTSTLFTVVFYRSLKQGSPDERLHLGIDHTCFGLEVYEFFSKMLEVECEAVHFS
jgi:hypothetical protein